MTKYKKEEVQLIKIMQGEMKMVASQRWDCGLKSCQGLLFLILSFSKLHDFFHYACVLVKTKQNKAK